MREFPKENEGLDGADGASGTSIDRDVCKAFAGEHPSPAEPAGDSLVCSCGHANPPGAQMCVKPTCRRMLRGNTIGWTTGLRVTTTGVPELRAIDEACRDGFEQDIIDAGGRAELIVRVFAAHKNRWELQATFDKITLALKTHGLFDRRARLRLAWVKQQESLAATISGIDRALGHHRRAKRVPTIHDYLRTKQQPEEPT